MNHAKDFLDAFFHISDEGPMTYEQAITALTTTQWWSKLEDEERRYFSLELRLSMK